MEERALFGAGLLLVVGFIIAVLATGHSNLVWAGVILLGVCLLAYAGDLLIQRHVRRNATVSDESDPIPSTHRAGADDDTPLGDTSEAHDEISPHDLPLDHPGRRAAERLAGERFERDRTGVTRGNQ